MSELPQNPEQEQTSIGQEVKEQFDQAREKATGGEKQSIIKAYQEAFDTKVLAALPPESRDKLVPKIQRLGVTISAAARTVGAKCGDLVSNAVHWPMVLADKDWPRDARYQQEVARADAWGTAAAKKTEIDLKKRQSYQDHFLAASLDIRHGSILGAVGSKIEKRIDAIVGTPATLKAQV